MLTLRYYCKYLRNFNKFSFASKKFYSDEKRISELSELSSFKRKPVISQGVKLYPGYQKSFEEQKISEFEGIYIFFFWFINRKKMIISFWLAKKLIEDFYGLNELEYEKDAGDDEMDEDMKLLQSLKRNNN